MRWLIANTVKGSDEQFSHENGSHGWNFIHVCFALTLDLPATKIAEFANSVHLDEVAHDLDLHYLPSSL